MKWIDREGIFRANPLTWCITKAKESQSVAVSIDFRILAQLDGQEWVSWEDCEEHHVRGDFWIIQKDGTVNTRHVEDLVTALGWDGDLTKVHDEAPDCVVQVTVKAETYEGKTKHRVAWIRPGDYVPQPRGAAPETVRDINARFGSLIRAAAGGALAARKTAQASKPAAKPAAVAAPVAAPASDAAPDDEVPF